MKQNILIIGASTLILFSLFSGEVFAEEKKSFHSEFTSQQPRMREGQEKKYESRNEEKPNFIDSIKEKVQQFIKVLKIGELTAINGKTLSVKENNGKIYSVLVNDKTILRRRFGGESKLSEFSPGDMVHIVGQWTDEKKGTISAFHIRNASIEKRPGVFIGEVTTRGSDSFMFAPVNRPPQTVMIGPSVRMVNRMEQPIPFSDIEVGHKVRVKGLWDREVNTMTEVDHVKDFSIPPPRPLPKKQ